MSGFPLLTSVMAVGVSLLIMPWTDSPVFNSTFQRSKPADIDIFGSSILAMISSFVQLCTVPRSGPIARPILPLIWWQITQLRAYTVLPFSGSPVNLRACWYFSFTFFPSSWLRVKIALARLRSFLSVCIIKPTLP